MESRFERLDHPSDDAGILAMICSTPVQIREQISFRKNAAEWISNKLTQSIIDAFGSIDTEMGYKKP